MWGSLGIFVNYIEVSSVQIALARTVLASITLLVIFIGRKQKLDIKAIKNNKLKLILAGFCMGFNWVALFEAYKQTSVSVATVVYYLAPAIVIAFSPIFFKEKLKFNKIIGLILAIVGMVFVSFSAGVGQVSITGVRLAFIGAVIYAVILISNKSIKGISGFEVAMIELMIAAVVLFVYSVFVSKETFAVPDSLSIVNLIIIGVFHTGICYGLYFTAVQRLRAQTSAICSFADPLSALLISAIFLGEFMSILQIIGAILIIGGAMFAEIYKAKEKLNE